MPILNANLPWEVLAIDIPSLLLKSKQSIVLFKLKETQGFVYIPVFIITVFLTPLQKLEN